MKKSALRKIIKEKLETNSKVSDVFENVIFHLRNRVYPKLDDDELYELNIKLKDWFNENVQ
jgi:hypothetical protein